MARKRRTTNYGTPQLDGTMRALHVSKLGRKKFGKGKSRIAGALFDPLDALVAVTRKPRRR